MKRASREAVEISRCIASFLETYAPAHRTSSGNTLRSYRCALSLYVTFLEQAKGVDPTSLCAGCFEREAIEEWMRWLRDERGCGPDTCNCRLGSIRAFLDYLGSRRPEFMRLYQDASRIPRMKAPKKKVCGMSMAAVKALMAAPDTTRRGGVRDLALMVFLYATAARIDEALSLKVGQMHLDGGRPYANIVGKGGKVRTLYLPQRSVEHVMAYMGIFHGEDPDPGAYLFYSRNKGPHGKLSQQAVNKMLKKHALEASRSCPEVPTGLHAHQFRHARASHWLEGGMNVVQISFLLGHESVETTMRYLDITLDDERAALSVLESEDDKVAVPKWRNDDGSLKSFCGFGSL